MEYTINNLYGYQEDYSYLEKVIKKTLKTEKVHHAIFSITFVGEEDIQKLNREYRGKDSITDVISFAFEDANKLKNKVRVLGDIYICIPRMIEQAHTYGHSTIRELAFLTVHGLLHLLGYDHVKEEDEKKMFAKQELILNATNIKR